MIGGATHTLSAISMQWLEFVHIITMLKGFFDVVREISDSEILLNNSIPKDTKERKLTITLLIKHKI